MTIDSGKVLRPYQVKAAKEMVARQRFYLADGPGVGKTPPTVVAIGQLGIPDTLIVCQKRGIGVWETHFEDWLGVKVKKYMSGHAKYSDITSPGVLVTNYEQLADVYARRSHWPIIVFDEAHEMRNRKTIRYKVAKYFTSSYLFMLSGTPVFKGAHDLWAPLAMLAPNQFPAYWPFVNKYAFNERSWGGSINTYGIKDPLRLQQDIAPYFLRRRKEDVLTELPEKFRYTIPIHMTPVQAVHYTDLVKTMMTETEEGLLLNQSGAVRDIRLRELLVSPRLLDIDDDGAAAPDLMARLEERGTPTLIFTPFKAGVSFLGDYIGQRGWEVNELIGGLSSSRTDAIVARFQESTKPNRVLICTVQVGTSWTGNTAMQTYFVGYDWAPQVNIQAEDRMHRYGGWGFECGYYSHMGTLDERVLKINGDKLTIENLTMNHRMLLDAGRV